MSINSATHQHSCIIAHDDLAYMAPEQLTEGGHVDFRTDVYGLGVVLFELLTGMVPFNDSTLAGLRKRILSEDPHPVRLHNRKVPPALEAICMKCLTKLAGNRYGSARELAEALTAFLNSQ